MGLRRTHLQRPLRLWLGYWVLIIQLVCMAFYILHPMRISLVICIDIYTCICAYIYVYSYMYIYIHTSCVVCHIFLAIHPKLERVRRNTHRMPKSPWLFRTWDELQGIHDTRYHICMYIYIHIWIKICIYAYACMYIDTYRNVCIYISFNHLGWIARDT